MGTIFEELIRRFNEENNEEAGEHFTPRDVVALMADLVLVPVADEVTPSLKLIYDGACGTGGMLSVAEERLKQIAADRGKSVAVRLFGQEINGETWAICQADQLIKGDAARGGYAAPEIGPGSGNRDFPARLGAIGVIPALLHGTGDT